MKKLALALVCLVSVAFFASCDPKVENPEPSIAVLTDTNYIQNGQVIEWGVDYLYGFKVASNPETQKELKSFKVVCGDQVLCDSTISGKEFTFEGGIVFSDIDAARVIVDTADIVATVTDVAGEFNTASIQVIINKEEYLVPANIEWIRKGSNLQGETATEMAKYGLGWEKRDPFHANIRPLENCKLYVIENNAAEFEAITTVAEKATYFAKLIEGGTAVEEYRNISVAANGEKEYNDILAVVDADGNQHLVLFRKANVLIETGVGVTTTITGEAK